jgi:hypothetical protein
MLVNDGGKAVVFQPVYDEILDRKIYHRISVSDFRTFFMNVEVQVGVTGRGSPIKRRLGDVWLEHPDRHQYLKGVICDPSGTPEGALNLWQGYAISPVKGDWSRMQDHLHKVVCAGGSNDYDWFLGWMANMLQHPERQGEVAVVLRGEEGSGKGLVAKALKRIVGHHSLAISQPRHLTGNFNLHLRDTVFLFVDEGFWAGDKAHEGVLKALITEPSLTIEGKGVNVVEVRNLLHVMMASNSDWVVPASTRSRRYCVFDVLDTRVGDFPYFKAIVQQMDAGGYAAMLHDLLIMDISGFDVREVPTTEGLQKQRKLSLPTTEAWWMDCLMRGYVFKSRLGLEDTFGRWSGVLSTDLRRTGTNVTRSAERD